MAEAHYFDAYVERPKRAQRSVTYGFCMHSANVCIVDTKLIGRNRTHYHSMCETSSLHTPLTVDIDAFCLLLTGRCFRSQLARFRFSPRLQLTEFGMNMLCRGTVV